MLWSIKPYTVTANERRGVQPWSVWASFILLTLTPFIVSGCATSNQSLEATHDKTKAQLFYGINEVKPHELCQLLPKTTGPRMVHFKSKFCMDCKALGEVLTPLLKKHPELQHIEVDILSENGGAPKGETYKPILNAFKPTTVPVLVMANSTCQITDVLYGTQSKAELEQSIQKATPKTTP